MLANIGQQVEAFESLTIMAPFSHPGIATFKHPPVSVHVSFVQALLSEHWSHVTGASVRLSVAGDVGSGVADAVTGL